MMYNIKKRRCRMERFFSILLVLLTFVTVPEVKAADTITYSYPHIGGVAMDWCKTLGKGCGRPAANYYCRARGHLYAVSYAKDNNIGYTRVIKTGQICNAPGCDGFRYITCRRSSHPVPAPAVKGIKRFHYPKIGGVALDWCYKFGKKCGYTAANAFCKSRGYWKGTAGYEKRDNIGYTRIFRSGRICNAPGCDGFRYIDCKR
jgi:hypothetical protein